MESYDGQKLTDSWRIALTALLFSLAILFLGNALYHVQVVQSSVLSNDQARQSIRRTAWRSRGRGRQPCHAAEVLATGTVPVGVPRLTDETFLGREVR